MVKKKGEWKMNAGIPCPKCRKEMVETFNFYKCKHCGYWEGIEHAYGRLVDKRRLW